MSTRSCLKEKNLKILKCRGVTRESEVIYDQWFL